MTATPGAGIARVRRRATLLRRSSIWAARIGLVVALVVLWVVADQLELVSPLVLPTFDSIVREVWHLVGESSTWTQLRVTSIETATAFLISSAAALLAGGLASRRARIAKLVGTLTSWAQLIPLVTVYPVFLISMGIGMRSKIAFAAVLAFFPMTLACIRALTSVDPHLKSVARFFGGSTLRTFWHVELPAARYGLLAAARIGAALSLIGVILGEMLGATEGVGAAITASGQTFDTQVLYAYIVFTLIITLVFNWLVNRGAREK